MILHAIRRAGAWLERLGNEIIYAAVVLWDVAGTFIEAVVWALVS